MPVLNGLDASRQIRARTPSAKILMLTMHRDAALARKAFQAGVLGYVLKVSAVEELIEAIEHVAHGKVYISSLLAAEFTAIRVEKTSNPEREGAPLTARQREVLQLIAEGRTMKEAAAVLGISPRTAESHKYEIMQVLGIQTTAELVHYALRNRLIGE
jgi:DNA-binding NarL/FixJ family response regulator